MKDILSLEDKDFLFPYLFKVRHYIDGIIFDKQIVHNILITKIVVYFNDDFNIKCIDYYCPYNNLFVNVDYDYYYDFKTLNIF